MKLHTLSFFLVFCFTCGTCAAQAIDSVAVRDSNAAPAVQDSESEENPELSSNSDSASAPVTPSANDSIASLPTHADTIATVPPHAADTVVPHPSRSYTGADMPSGKSSRKTDMPVQLHVSVNIDLNAKTDPFIDLTMEEAVTRLLDNNPDVNRARLEWLAGQNKLIAAFGNFEPALVGNIKHEMDERPTALLEQIQNTYTGGIEGLLPTATKYSLNFSLTDIQHHFPENITLPTTFAGLTLTQPLLQGLWYGKPVIDIKSARIDREIALQKYRSALSGKIYELENAYWKLCCAQEKLLFATQSVDIAQEIVDDSKLQVRVGKISPVEALEASADLASRLANRADAQKDLYSAINDLKLLIAGPMVLKDTLVHASTPLSISAEDSTADLHGKESFGDIETIQPDYVQKKYELEKERVALDYQANQCLPELNIKGTFGYDVTANATDYMWQRFSNPAYRARCGTYSAEVEFRLPLGMNIKERNLLAAEKCNVQSAEINLQATRIQIENYLSISRKRIVDLRKNLQNAKIVVDYRKTLLKAEIMRQKAGTSNYRKVFEIEEDLTKSQQWELENIVDYKTTKAELARLTGTTMLDKKLESFRNGKAVLVKKLTGMLNKP